MNAWDKLISTSLLQEIERALENIDLDLILIDNTSYNIPPRIISFRLLNIAIENQFFSYGWRDAERAGAGNSREDFLRNSVDLIKNYIAVKIFFGKRAFLESEILIKFPLLYNKGAILLPIVIVPVREMKKFIFHPGIAYFEIIKEIFINHYKSSIKYPFLILGISDNKNEAGEINVFERNTQLDTFLIYRLGMSLNEAILNGESDNLDFKEVMPENKNVSREACAFANTQNGGLLIFGIDNYGNIVGISDDQWDEYQTKLTNLLSTTCSPAPEFKIIKFDIEHSDRKLFILDVNELANKPCVSNDDKIYVRKGGTARPAQSEDVRRMILR